LTPTDASIPSLKVLFSDLMIIAIDGPAGVGKSSAAKALAQKLNFTYVDTGAMYRAVALSAIEKDLDPKSDAATIAKIAEELPLHFEEAGKSTYIGERNVSHEIRSPEVSLFASKVAALKSVREVLVHKQRHLGRAAEQACGGAVLEGRDIQTVVFPRAEVKVFLIASPITRAARRQQEWEEEGKKIHLDDAQTQLSERDQRDTERAAAPLQPAEDADLIATDGLTLEQVVEKIMGLVRAAQK
jgi:cytidylate kinase